MTDKIKVGRLAFRTEGDNWNAYYAMMGTMEGAVLLGSIQMAVAASSKRREAFIALMRDFISEFYDISGVGNPDWSDPIPAPEHERTFQ